MSLINQALRKAQRDRTPSSMSENGASQGNAGPAPAPAAPSGMKPGIVIGLAVALALMIGLVAGLSMVLLSRPEAAPADRGRTPPKAPIAPIQQPTTPSSTAQQPITPAPAAANTCTRATCQ